MDKHKAMAILVTNEDPPNFLVVHDRRHSEWTFVTGGCRRKEIENPIVCALRELEEETRGLINIKECKYSYFKFDTFQRDFDGDYTAIYHVYVIDYILSREDQKTLVDRFKEEKHKMDQRELVFKKQYDENDSLDFVTLENLKKRIVWPLITRYVLENPKFREALTSERKRYIQ